jgi:crotonobetainyl-CoA:carnitine CoA-transferase CaiB-like acyl-CoA transferase
MSGLMSITGPVDGPPYKVGVAVSDIFTGFFAVSSILAALRHAEHTGKGQHLDVALLDSQIAALVNIASNYLVSGETPERFGNEHPNIVPYQIFRAADRDFVVATGNDRQFAALCELVGQPELATDPRYSNNSQRLENRASLIESLQAGFATRPAEAWVQGLLTAGIPAGSINDVATSLNDPQVQARGLIQQIPLKDDNLLSLIGPPVKFSGTPSQITLPPPLLGQHTDHILREILHLDEAAISAYHQSGVI